MRKLLKILMLIFVVVIFLHYYSNHSQAVTPTPTPITINPQSPLDQIEQQLNCGKIGYSCCSSIQIPSIKLGKPSIAPILDQGIGWIVDFINGIIDKVRLIVKFASNIITDPISEIGCSEGRPSASKNDPTCTCLPNETFNLAKLCINISDDNERKECIDCSTTGVWTALGCIDFSLGTFVKDKVFGLGIGLAGLVALLCIIYAAFQLQTSQGNQERIKKAQEMLTSCIMGLMLIIFSVFILRLIGVDILRIPGFTSK